MITIEQIEQKILAEKNQPSSSSKKILSLSDKLAARILYVLANKEIFEKYLTELDAKIADKVNLTNFSNAPTQYATLLTHQLPYPPDAVSAQGDHLVQALESILIEHEQQCGVNLGRSTETVSRFIGQVPADMADQFVSRGDIWNDDNFDLIGFVHGEYSHRIQRYVWERAFEDDPSLLVGISAELKQPLI